MNAHMQESVFAFEATNIVGEHVPFSSFMGSPMLVVNTASACGFTPQLAGLESLHRQFRNRGLIVLGFPCNQFGAQDSGSNASISTFCTTNFGVSFAMMSKVAVKGLDAHPLFKWLTARAPGLFGTQSIKWNFTKFLIDGTGREVHRFGPATKPASLIVPIDRLLVAAQGAMTV